MLLLQLRFAHCAHPQTAVLQNLNLEAYVTEIGRLWQQFNLCSKDITTSTKAHDLMAFGCFTNLSGKVILLRNNSNALR